MEDRWNIAYRHSAGDVNAAFFRSLRDDAALLARRCAVCGRRTVPPCQCHDDPRSRWEVCDPGGILLAATPMTAEPDLLLGLIQMEGCDGSLVQRVRTGGGSVAANAPVRAVFAEIRHGRMNDFWFEPVRGQEL